jgi:hypothetical protein
MIEDRAKWKFDEYASAIRQDIDNRDKHEESLRLRKNLRAIRYWEGRHLGYISPATGQWVDVKVKDGDPFYPNNQIRYFCRSILKEMVRSKPQLSVQPRDDRMESAGAARLVRGILARYRDELFGPSAAQTEAMFSMLEGNYFRYVWWDMTNNRYTTELTDYEEQEVPIGRPSYYCAACGSNGYLDEQQTSPNPPPQEGGLSGSMPCPNCGGSAMLLPQMTKKATLPVGSHTVSTGDISSDIVDPMEMKVHLRSRTIRQTPFLERTRMIHRRLGKMLFTHWDWRTDSLSSSSNKPALAIIADLEASPGNYKSHKAQGAYSRSQDANGDLIQFTQIWVDKVYYFDTVLEEDFSFGVDAAGQPIKFLPKDTNLMDAFPNGMYLAFLGDKLVDYRDEDKAKHWTHGTYILAPNRFWGDGAADDSLDQQWELNNLDSLLIEHIMFNVGGQTWYNPLKIEGSTLGARPRERNPMKNASPTDNPGNFIFERKAVEISPQVPGKSEQIKRDMQAQFGAFSVSSGMPDVNVSTATGMAILRDQALGFLGPPLELRGEVDVEWAYQVLELLQKNMVGERYITYGQYDDQEGQWFSSSNVRTDFIITQVPGSWFPVSDFDMRQRVMELASFGAVPMGIFNPQWPHEIKSYVLEKYGMPLTLDNVEPDERKQKIELIKMKEALASLKQAGGVLVDAHNQPDPLAVEFVASVAPPEMFVDIDDVHFDWISKYLKTDEGMAESPVIRAALLLHQRAHVDNKYKAQQMLQIMQGIATGALIPMPDGSVMPAGAGGGVVPANEGGGDSKSPQQSVRQPQNANVGSPAETGSNGDKRVGDNLPLAKVGSTAPGSQPATQR